MHVHKSKVNIPQLKRWAKGAGASFGKDLEFFVGESISGKQIDERFKLNAREIVGEGIVEASKIIEESFIDMENPENLRKALNANALRINYMEIIESLGFYIDNLKKNEYRVFHRRLLSAIDNPENYDLINAINSTPYERIRRFKLAELKERIKDEGIEDWEFAHNYASMALEGRPNTFY